MATHVLHLVKVAALTSSSKQTEILDLKESVKTQEDLFRLTSEKEKRLSNNLFASKAKNTELEKKLNDEEVKSVEAERNYASKVKNLSDKVAYLESQEYTAKVHDIFQSSE